MLESDSGLRPITPPGLECHHILCSPVNALRVLLFTISIQHSTQPLETMPRKHHKTFSYA